ncbi:MAG: hypothetical protein ABWX73_12840 [Marmoricola sp.]
MPNIDLQRLVALETELKLKPAVVTYSRLEPVNLSSGDLTPGLEVQIADPLWMVGRQWQFEELRGEDGGSPILAEVSAEHGPVTRFHPGSPAGDGDAAGRSFDVPGSELPVEVAVEAESPAVLPERVRAQLGMQLLRLTRAAGLPKAVLPKVEKAFLTEWAFSGATDPEVDPAGAARRRLVSGRVPDGAAAAADLVQRRGPGGKVRSLPPSVRQAATADPHRAKLREALSTWLTWAEAYVAAPVGASWDPHRLEYGFALQAGLSTGDVVLRADEYVGGTVDWYSFDAAATPGLGAPATPVAPTPVHQTVMPTPVRYPGMPSDRLWAFEDAHVYLGGVKAGSTDLARLALVEFSLVFGNDWFLVPFDLPYGNVARVHDLRVVDTFGTEVQISPSRDVGRPGWTVFQNTPVDDRSALADVFVLPATVRHALEGPPLEEVALFRDEMANLVWGVERIVQGPSGEPVRRGLVESRSLRQQLPGDLDDAAIVYRLMTPVPDHWVPFVSVPVPDVPVSRFATELERRPMVRFLPGGATEIVHPHGLILRADPEGDVADDRLRVAEEEVPRDGIVVTRRFQLARTPGGGTVLWVGRRKQAGQGEGSSGLKFDTALPPGGL